MPRECSICGEPESSDVCVAGLTVEPNIMCCDESECLGELIKLYPHILDN